jgi:hypothetical protein
MAVDIAVFSIWRLELGQLSSSEATKKLLVDSSNLGKVIGQLTSTNNRFHSLPVNVVVFIALRKL